MSGSLVPFLDPGSVAVIGASRDPFKVGGSVVANLRSAGFRGRIIPVNSRASTVQGLAAVPRVQDVKIIKNKLIRYILRTVFFC